jgi:peroxiredoxin
MTSGSTQQQARAGILAAGSAAPDFTLNSTPDQKLSLSELRGRPVVLAFYPADWSPVCGDEMALFNAVLPDIEELGAAMVGISVDGVWCHAAFARARNLHFPLLADFEPKGEVSRLYGAYRAKEGVSERALFVVDAMGTIAWSYLSPIGVNPGADGVLRALEALQGRQGAAAASSAARPDGAAGDRDNASEARA